MTTCIRVIGVKHKEDGWGQSPPKHVNTVLDLTSSLATKFGLESNGLFFRSVGANLAKRKPNCIVALFRLFNRTPTPTATVLEDSPDEIALGFLENAMYESNSTIGSPNGLNGVKQTCNNHYTDCADINPQVKASIEKIVQKIHNATINLPPEQANMQLKDLGKAICVKRSINMLSKAKLLNLEEIIIGGAHALHLEALGSIRSPALDDETKQYLKENSEEITREIDAYNKLKTVLERVTA